MQNKQMKDLWHMRFQKIFELERDSFYFYKKLINNNRELLQDSEAAGLLRKIMRDELKHARAALELLHIVDGKDVTDSEDNGSL